MAHFEGEKDNFTCASGIANMNTCEISNILSKKIYEIRLNPINTLEIHLMHIYNGKW